MEYTGYIPAVHKIDLVPATEFSMFISYCMCLQSECVKYRKNRNDNHCLYTTQQMYGIVEFVRPPFPEG